MSLPEVSRGGKDLPVSAERDVDDQLLGREELRQVALRVHRVRCRGRAKVRDIDR